MELGDSAAVIPDSFMGYRDDITMQMTMILDQIRAPLIVPVLRLAVYICLTMSVMLFVERVYMGIVISLVKLFGRKPEKRFKWEPMKDDIEHGNSVYPMVLVQIPMYNEREVYQLSIGAACGLSWPSDRIVIQVLDDSTDPTIKDLVEKECSRWASKGINIKYEIRDNRNGYKAGALKEGMKKSYVKSCDYVAIFDADFQPEPDYLWRTVPFLLHNPKLALVQARWKFGRSPSKPYKHLKAQIQGPGNETRQIRPKPITQQPIPDKQRFALSQGPNPHRRHHREHRRRKGRVSPAITGTCNTVISLIHDLHTLMTAAVCYSSVLFIG